MTTAWGQTLDQQSSTDTDDRFETSQSTETKADTENSSTDKSTESASVSSEKNNNDKNNRDPIGSTTDERFIPTEEISEDLPVSFPVDI